MAGSLGLEGLVGGGKDEVGVEVLVAAVEVDWDGLGAVPEAEEDSR